MVYEILWVMDHHSTTLHEKKKVEFNNPKKKRKKMMKSDKTKHPHKVEIMLKQ